MALRTNPALTNAVARIVSSFPTRGGHFTIQALPAICQPLRKHMFQLLQKQQRIQAFDQLINITLHTQRNEYIDAVLYLGRFLLSNNYINECYIFLTVCQQRIETVYGEPIDFTLYEQIGNMFYLTGQCEYAIKWYQKLMEMNQAPESKMYFNIGMCYQVMQDWENAINAYKQSTMADSRFTHSWINLGGCYLKAGNGQKAVQAYQQLPLSGQSLTCIGNAHFRMGNLQQAIAQYLKAVELKEDAGTYNNLGCALKKVGLFQDSIYAFTDSIAIQPNQEAASNLITLYIELDKVSEAATLLRNCTRILSQGEIRSLGKLIDEIKQQKPVMSRLTIGGIGAIGGIGSLSRQTIGLGKKDVIQKGLKSINPDIKKRLLQLRCFLIKILVDFKGFIDQE